MNIKDPPRVRGLTLLLVTTLALFPLSPTSTDACPGNPPPGIAINDPAAGALGKCLCELIECSENYLSADTVQAVKDAKRAGCIRIGNTAAVAAAMRIDRVQECINDQLTKKMDVEEYHRIREKCERETRAVNASTTVAFAAHTSKCIMFNSDKLKHPDATGMAGLKKTVVFEEMYHFGNDHVVEEMIDIPDGKTLDGSNVRALRELYKELYAVGELIEMWRKNWPKQKGTINELYLLLDRHVKNFCFFHNSMKWSNGKGVPASDTENHDTMETYLHCKLTAWCLVLDGIDEGHYTPTEPETSSEGQSGYKSEALSGDASDKAAWRKKMKGLGYDV